MSQEKTIAYFPQKVMAYYDKEHRDFPWRQTSDPYCILVSEFMLQQTQTNRIIEKYLSFLKEFPDIATLAQATLSQVLIAWQGLGYNRRAKYLHLTAQIIVDKYRSVVPYDIQTLDSLPGIGPYTAAAISTFAFNKPHVFIETNIRSAYIHEFFNDAISISDAEILPLIERTLMHENPREWYYALMDYGAMVKKRYGNPNRRSVHYTKQSPFEGSQRQQRGAIIRMLANKSLTTQEIAYNLHISISATLKLLSTLSKESLIVNDRSGSYTLAD